MNKIHMNKIQWKKLLYPTASSILALLIVFIFFSSASFLSKNFNQIFDNESLIDETTNIDFSQLELVGKKLGINLQKEPEPTVEQEQIPAMIPEIKENLKIKILNGSNVLGAANLLRSDLSQAGFNVNKIGNAGGQEQTSFQIKPSVLFDYQNSISELQSIIENKYILVRQNLSDDDEFDVVIILGKQ